MARGPKKHLKRIRAPRSWMMDKTGGIFATRPSQGPHRLRESMPLHVILRQRLKYALKGVEVKMILNEREGNVKVDGRIRRDHAFPLGIMDVLSIEKSGENFRLLYDNKGRFKLHKLTKPEEANYKLLRIKHKAIGPNKIPYIVGHDARTIRFPNPDIDVHDSIKLNLKDNKIEEIVKCEIGNTCMVTFGKNIGRIGVITHREKHLGGFDIVHLKDQLGHEFATRISNIFMIGKRGRTLISLPRDMGLRLTAEQESEMKQKKMKRDDLIKEKHEKEHTHTHQQHKTEKTSTTKTQQQPTQTKTQQQQGKQQTVTNNQKQTQPATTTTANQKQNNQQSTSTQKTSKQSKKQQ